ncbi:MAG: hypothetical protein AB7Q42_08800 [Acidimicrobiia bacterium]
MPDEQDQSEALDDDKLGLDALTSDDEATDFPPERPLGVDDPAVIQRNESVGESVDDRERREEPDVFEGGQSGSTADEDEAEEIADDAPELIADPDDESAEEAALHIEDPGRA